jgi:hypothetical protein
VPGEFDRLGRRGPADAHSYRASTAERAAACGCSSGSTVSTAAGSAGPCCTSGAGAPTTGDYPYDAPARGMSVDGRKVRPVGQRLDRRDPRAQLIPKGRWYEASSLVEWACASVRCRRRISGSFAWRFRHPSLAAVVAQRAYRQENMHAAGQPSLPADAVR